MKNWILLKCIKICGMKIFKIIWFMYFFFYYRAHLPTVTYLRLDGSVPAGDRHDLVYKFNTDPSIDLLLLTTHVGGLGLNLTGADTVYWFFFYFALIFLWDGFSVLILSFRFQILYMGFKIIWFSLLVLQLSGSHYCARLEKICSQVTLLFLVNSLLLYYWNLYLNKFDGCWKLS